MKQFVIKKDGDFLLDGVLCISFASSPLFYIQAAIVSTAATCGQGYLSNMAVTRPCLEKYHLKHVFNFVI